MKRIGALALLFFFIFSSAALAETESKEELCRIIWENQQKKIEIESHIEELEKLGLNIPLELAKDELAKTEETILTFQTKYDIIIAEEWIEKTKEWPVASQIFRHLKNCGYSDAVACGVLGNLMKETAGDTFDIKWDSETKQYYGICQWNKKRFKDVIGASLEDQLIYLTDSIEYEFEEFGYCYKKGFGYQDFLELKNEQEAAKAFSMIYERCNKKSIEQRKENATTALNYFGGY